MEINQIVQKIEEIINTKIENGMAYENIKSIQYIKLLVCIEEEFDIEFDDEDLGMNRFDSLEKLATYVAEKINNILLANDNLN